MAGSIPPGLKPVKAFLMRALEMEKSKHQLKDIIAYACRRYAVEKALSTVDFKSMPAVGQYLGTLMDQLEKDKAEIDDKYTSEEGSLTKEKQLGLVRDYALKIFKSSEDTYKEGRATKGTAKSFYAAATFLEVSGGNDEQMINMRKLAKFKASEILNALKEGRPAIPPSTGVEEVTPAERTPSIEMAAPTFDLGIDLPPAPNLGAGLPDFGSAFNTTVVANDENMESDEGPDEVIPSFAQLPTNARLSTRGREFVRQNSASGNYGGKGNKQTLEAEGYARRAVDAFKKNDVYGGIENICEALQILESRKPPMNVPDHGISDVSKLDVIEHLLFAARTLECTGELFSLADGKKRAANLLSNALQIAQRG